MGLFDGLENIGKSIVGNEMVKGLLSKIGVRVNDDGSITYKDRTYKGIEDVRNAVHLPNLDKDKLIEVFDSLKDGGVDKITELVSKFTKM